MLPSDEPALVTSPSNGSWIEVLLVFLRLGCLSFGGPIAHIGYLQAECVERRRWCTNQAFAEIVALAQSLPGPASSQVAFTLGLIRARLPGAFAAWAGFTLPSALLMLAFAYGHALLTGALGSAMLHGLQIVAVAIVAQAVLTMQRSLAPDTARIALALLAATITLFAPANIATPCAIAIGAILGALFLRSPASTPTAGTLSSISRRTGFVCAALFTVLLALPPILTRWIHAQPLAVFNAFYHSGALVFGGGHVVLPLLERAVVTPGWIDQATFLSGYGAAQAVPGPLFTFAAYLGAVIHPSVSPLLLSATALAAIFLPGLLLLLSVLPFWNILCQRPRLQSALAGINASVVGALFAAFLRPVCTTALHSAGDVLVATAALLTLVRLRLAPWIVVLVTVAIATLWSTVHR